MVLTMDFLAILVQLACLSIVTMNVRRTAARRSAFQVAHRFVWCTWWSDNVVEGLYGGLYIVATSPVPVVAERPRNVVAIQ